MWDFEADQLICKTVCESQLFNRTGKTLVSSSIRCQHQKTTWLHTSAPDRPVYPRMQLLCLAGGVPAHHQQNGACSLRQALPAPSCRSSRQPAGCRPSMRRASSSQHPQSSSPSDSDLGSEEEADQKVRRLQRLNSIQQGYLDRRQRANGDGDKSICCWDDDGDGLGLPKNHTSRQAAASPTDMSQTHTSIRNLTPSPLLSVRVQAWCGKSGAAECLPRRNWGQPVRPAALSADTH